MDKSDTFNWGHGAPRLSKGNKMIPKKPKKKLYKLTQHAQKRMRERGIFYKGVLAAVKNPDIMLDGVNKTSNLWFKWNENRKEYMAISFVYCPEDPDMKLIFSVYWCTSTDCIYKCDRYIERVAWCKQRFGQNPRPVYNPHPVIQKKEETNART